jgi:RNA polymerase sigma factor (sigma-70 family)
MSITKARAPDGSHWAELMASVTQQRDRESFMRIYDHFAPRVRLYLKGLGLPEGQAEELAQETLLRLWQRAAQYDPARGALSTWLFRVARNLHIDRKRREPQWASIEEEADLAGDLEDTVSLSPERLAEQAQLASRIDRLSPGARDPHVLFRSQDAQRDCP